MPDLLPLNALEGLRLGVSVSESPDLARLGLLETHFRLALAEIARCILVSGGTLAYGGHLKPEGYTPFLLKEVQKYGRRDRPLVVVLAWQEHRGLALPELIASKQELGLHGQIVCLDVNGEEVDPADGRGEDPEPTADPEIRRCALTGLRIYMGQHTRGRVLIGGKRHGFQGVLPGLMEEALIAIGNDQPLYLAGGFGGVTSEIATALLVDDGLWLPRRADAPTDDPRLVDGRSQLCAFATDRGWVGLKNGLTDDENRRLAATHRPSEIATLVSLGLGRRFVRVDGASQS
jgi:hypothetical protein